MVLRSLFHLSLSVGISYSLVNMDIGAWDRNLTGHAMAAQPHFCMLLQFCWCFRNIADTFIDGCPKYRIVLWGGLSALSEIYLNLLPIEGKQRFITLLFKCCHPTVACLS